MASIMSGSRQILKQLELIIRAKYPILYLVSWEENRVIHYLEHILRTNFNPPKEIICWSSTEGMKKAGQVIDKGCATPAHALDFVQRSTDNALFILKDFHVYMGSVHQGRPENPDLIRKIKDLAAQLKKTYKTLILLSPLIQIPEDLKKTITLIEFPPPTAEEITSILNNLIAKYETDPRVTIQLTSPEKVKLVKAALGLTLEEAESAFALALVKDKRLDISDVKIVLEEKKQIIKKIGLLEYIETDETIDQIGGLENLKNWFKKREKVFLDEAKEYGLPSPKGVLLTGMPGCGKSLSAKAIASLWGLPLLRLDMGKVFSGIVGSSEENIRTIIFTVESIAPAILWIDEIEKGFSGSEGTGDSGTSARVFSSFLTWMQEKQTPVFIVATANNIDRLPPELLRKGRFDEIFFVDLPSLRERRDIFTIHIKKRCIAKKACGEFTLTKELLTKLALASKGFSGAEIEQTVIEGFLDAYYADRSITEDDLVKSVCNTIPLSRTRKEKIDHIRQWANERAVRASKNYESEERRSNDSVNDIPAGRDIEF
ncbi:MAG: AAA family ATPase [bacterium]